MIATWCLAVVLQAAPTDEEPLRPNVLIVLADDLGFGDLGCTGNTQIHTPNLDRMAEQGTLFTSFYVASPTCSPSRAAFMTGRFPSELGVVRPLKNPKKREATEAEAAALPLDVPNVARVLGAAGYRTGHIGKWHLGPAGDEASRPERYGFEFARVPFERDPVSGERDNGLKTTAGMIDAALEFVDEPDDRPFFLQVWLRDPHAPLPPKPPGIERYDHYKAEFFDFHGPPAVYMATVTEIDAQVGRLTTELKSRGKLRDTLVVFTSDNGPEVQRVPDASSSAGGSPGPFRGMKRSLYEGGIRVPLIVRWPALVPTRRVDASSLLSAVDFLPTLAGLCGAEVPEPAALDGVDVRAALAGEPFQRARPLYYEFHFGQFGREIDMSPMLAVRDGDWMLLCNKGGADTELYDVANDLGQRRDRAAEEPERAKEMRRALVGWFRTLGITDLPDEPPGERWKMPEPTRAEDPAASGR